MAGIIFLLIFLGWAFISIALTISLTGKISKKRNKIFVSLIAFPIVLISPLSDEIVAAPQVHRICSEGAVIHVKPERAEGKEVRIIVSPSWEKMSGTIVPISYSHFSFRVIGSDEEIASFNIYHVSGGVLSRFINFNNVSTPWLINTSECYPEGFANFEAKYNFKVVN